MAVVLHTRETLGDTIRDLEAASVRRGRPRATAGGCGGQRIGAARGVAERAGAVAADLDGAGQEAQEVRRAVAPETRLAAPD